MSSFNAIRDTMELELMFNMPTSGWGYGDPGPRTPDLPVAIPKDRIIGEIRIDYETETIEISEGEDYKNGIFREIQ